MRWYVGSRCGRLRLVTDLFALANRIAEVPGVVGVVLGGSRYPEQGADIERSFTVLRSLPADIWVSSHARLWGRYRKFTARDTAQNPADPFIDPAGYRAYIDSGEARFRRGVVQ